MTGSLLWTTLPSLPPPTYLMVWHAAAAHHTAGRRRWVLRHAALRCRAALLFALCRCPLLPSLRHTSSLWTMRAVLTPSLPIAAVSACSSARLRHPHGSTPLTTRTRCVARHAGWCAFHLPLLVVRGRSAAPPNAGAAHFSAIYLSNVPSSPAFYSGFISIRSACRRRRPPLLPQENLMLCIQCTVLLPRSPSTLVLYRCR